MADKLRWGILSTAQIARKNWKAIRNSGNSTAVAVASRDANRCQQFIAECQSDCPMEAPPRAFASYQELLASKEIDAVYIPLPTGLRKEWVIRAAGGRETYRLREALRDERRRFARDGRCLP